MNQPNIILITADGLRADALGCAGNPDVRTPNIDALAAHGIQFSNAFTPYAQCPGGGHAFLTGAAASAMAPEAAPDHIAPQEFVLPARLRTSGYTTCAIGALDMTGARAAGRFDRVQSLGCEGLEDEYQAWLAEDGLASGEDEDSNSAALLSEARHPTTWTGNQAVRHVQAASEPFFLWVSFPRPRWPLDPPVPWKHMYRPSRLQLPAGYGAAAFDADLAIAAPEDRTARTESDFRRLLTAWYGCISHADRQIGRLLATLTARGRTNNIFVLTAGRGAYLGYHGLLHTAPGPLYEPLIRVPLIIGGVAGQRRGSTDPALVSTADIAPTLLGAAHLDTGGMDGGRGLERLLHEPGLTHRQAVVLCGPDGPLGVRDARYKWLGPGCDGGEALYDLQADPLERHNLRGERQSAAIRNMLLEAVDPGAVAPKK